MSGLNQPLDAFAPEPAATLLHRRLAHFNQKRLRPSICTSAWRADLAAEMELRELEGSFAEAERQAIWFRLARLPTDVEGFMNWFEGLRERGPGQDDALFDWLATRADQAQMAWFLTQEIAGEAGFDDLVALTQVRFPMRAKLEMARNYWDEMGRGHEDAMHGPMLEKIAHEMALQASIESTVWESLALANLMTALATNRRYAYHSIGALGVIEMTAPGRVSKVNEGLKRLAVPPIARRYFQLHAGLDVKHSASWNREVIQPLIAADPALARPIAEGALMRLSSGARCFWRYRLELGV